MKKYIQFTAQKCNWHTPAALYDELNKEFGFNDDPCPEAGIFGVERAWGTSTYCNPPYGPSIREWLDKGISEASEGKVVVFLLPSRTDTKWFHDLVLPNASEIRFIKGRLCFSDKGPAPFPSMVVVFDRKKHLDKSMGF